MRRASLWLLLIAFLSVALIFPKQIKAQSPTHNTIIINQVRGTECCSPGGVNELSQQLTALKDHELPATFTVRWDALHDREMVRLLRQARQNGHEIGGFLEITPELAKASGVEYKAAPEQWYEASNAYLIGYSPTDRKKLLDTYMSAFQQAFGTYPKTTTAWMIDADSLQRLSQEYGVRVHQITREQWGVDSYTLTGGPPHMPFKPSENWALIPDEGQDSQMPLIVRQTITDPVWNYGDPTSSRTSQPNDFRLKDRPFSYFEHLFTQAHDQPTETHTFALVGLENSMPEIDQQTFTKQLEFIKQWQQSGPERAVLTAQQYEQWWRRQSPQELTVYAGKDESEPLQAWWITTPQYRARVRQDGTELAITDLRLYNQQWTDPYLSQPSGRVAYWVVPFVVDGSRFFIDDQTNALGTLAPDNLTGRHASLKNPTRWILTPRAEAPQLKRSEETLQLVDGEQVLAEFSPEGFTVNQAPEYATNNSLLQNAVKTTEWDSPAGQELWGFRTADNKKFTAFTATNDLAPERDARYPLLFPEVRVRPLDPAKSELFRNNQFAQAGRNPVRLVFFPRDEYGFPVLTDTEPTISTDPAVDISWERPHGSNGMMFVDFFSENPQKVSATFTINDFTETLPIYFAPNCKQQIRWCLTHPRQIWWYLQNRWGDQERARQEAEQAELF